MNRRFHLYPENKAQQRLRLSASLVDIHRLEGFDETIAPFGVEVIEAPDRMIAGSYQELAVRPPIPAERLAAFGDALIKFAKSYGLEYHNDVLFVDHTSGGGELPGRLTAEYMHLAAVLGPRYPGEAE